MAFSKANRIAGIKASLKSPNTPEHLKAGLKKYLRKLKGGN
jgi:hypothetical protein